LHMAYVKNATRETKTKRQPNVPVAILSSRQPSPEPAFLTNISAFNKKSRLIQAAFLCLIDSKKEAVLFYR